MALHGPGEAASAQIAAMRSAGARIETATADVADASSISAAIPRADRDGPPISGVFHLAMVLDDGVALSLDPERMRHVMAPKATGALHLHRQTSDRPLDHFASSPRRPRSSARPGARATRPRTHSSTRSPTTGAGSASRRSHWGGWSIGGDATAPVVRGRGIDRRLLRFDPGSGLSALERLLASPRPAQVCVLPVEPARWSREFRGTGPTRFLADLVEAGSTPTAVRRRAELDRQGPLERLPWLVGLVVDIWPRSSGDRFRPPSGLRPPLGLEVADRGRPRTG
mgnify:CR=1 FL=1